MAATSDVACAERTRSRGPDDYLVPIRRGYCHWRWFQGPQGELVIDAGIVKTWDEWQACNPPLAQWNNGDGLFYRVNPMRHGGKTDEDVTDFRHALLEFDLDANGQPIPKEVQFAFLLKFSLPMVALIDSGNKSLHGIVRLDAVDRAQFDERVSTILSLFPDHCVDRSNKNPSRYTRLPGFPRENGREPRLLAINLGPPDYATWEKQRRLTSPIWR